MPSVTMYKNVDVEFEVDLEDFDKDELQDELERRGLAGVADSVKCIELIENIWQLRRLNQPCNDLVDKLVYETIGKII